MDPSAAPSNKKIFTALWAAFVAQVAGRLLDFQWHRTHSEFETGRDQIQAHWLLWMGTVLVLVVAAGGLRSAPPRAERRGYLTVVTANVLFGAVSVIHYIQHLNRQEVDWAHISLGVTNIGSVVGVLMVTAAYLHSRNRPHPAAS
jgi:hypothetical protein